MKHVVVLIAIIALLIALDLIFSDGTSVSAFWSAFRHLVNRRIVEP